MKNRQVGVGATVQFDTPDAGPVSGEVVWREDNTIGLRFETELSYAQAVSLGLEKKVPVLRAEPIPDYQAAPHWLRLRCRVAA